MDNIKFGKFIRESRLEMGLTQKQLAEQIHVSDKAVSKWENGAGFPDIKILEPLAACLGVSLLELMQSEKMAKPQIDREEAEQVVADTISQSKQAEEWKRRMWKARLLLGACAFIFIRDKLVQGLLDSAHVDKLQMDVRLKAGIDKVIPGQWHTLNLYVDGVNCIEALDGVSEDDVVWNTGEDASVLQGTEAKCIVSQKLFEKKGWKLGDKVTLCLWYYYREDEKSSELFGNPLQTVEYEIAGYVDMMSVWGVWNDQFAVPPDVIVPFHAVRLCHQQEEIPFFASSASFQVADALSLNAFKQEMKDLGFRSVAPTVPDSSISGVALNVNDAAFISTAEHLRQVIDTVRAFFPFLLILIVGVGYLITLLLLQSRKNEMALLRSIGLNRRKCFRIFFVDQLTLVITGVVAGSVLSVLIQGNYGSGSALAGALVGICYMAGNSLALWKLLGVSVMEALFVAE